MSDAQTQATDEEFGDEGSPVINSLRQDLRQAQKQLKEKAEELEKLSGQVTQARSNQAKQFVDAAGYPTLDVNVVLERVEGDVTADSVAAALKSIGLSERASADVEPGPESEPEARKVPVSEMGRRVAEAASDSPVKNLDAKLAAATSTAEINAIMAEFPDLQHGGI